MAFATASDILALIKKGATIQAQEKIMELRQAVMDAQEENIALREQVQSLKQQLQAATSKPKLPNCPKCGEPAFKLESSVPDPIMGAVGIFRRKFTCQACGFTEDRQGK